MKIDSKFWKAIVLGILTYLIISSMFPEIARILASFFASIFG